MNEESGNPMTWKGQESIQPILETLRQNGSVMFHFPESYHHTLFVHMYPEQQPGQAETIDMESSVALLARIAKIKSLEHIAGLIEPVQAMGCTVKLTSPTPTVLIKSPHRDE
jgi:hypothetical protein